MQREVILCEMSPRDGLQALNRAAVIPLEDRVCLVTALQRARLYYIEAGAFVSARRIPAMADSAELFERLTPYEGELAALVPNMKYFEKCANVPNVDTVALFVSASEAYSLKNTRMTIDEALFAATEVCAAAMAKGHRVRAHVSGAFRDLTGENGPTPAADVVRVCERLRDAGGGGMVVALADTDGNAGEEDLQRVIPAVESALGLDRVGVHLHDRAGAGVGNARVAWDLRIRVFDCAVGGIGGNPTALDDPAGNVATEKLVEMFEEMGVSTGVDRGALGEAVVMVGEMAALAAGSEDE